MTTLRDRIKGISWLLITLTFFLALIADQLTKLIVLQTFVRGEIREVIPGFFNLTLHFNKGAAFGLFAGLDDGIRQLTLAVLSKLAIVMLIVFLIYEFYQSRWGQFSVALILGGAAGNVIDRVYRGEVVDFLDFYVAGWHWPAFNVADSCICIGVAILFFFESWGKRPKSSTS